MTHYKRKRISCMFVNKIINFNDEFTNYATKFFYIYYNILALGFFRHILNMLYYNELISFLKKVLNLLLSIPSRTLKLANTVVYLTNFNNKVLNFPIRSTEILSK